MYGPVTGSAATVDSVFNFFLVVSIILIVVIMSLTLFFAFRYHRSRHPKAEQISGSVPLEIIWTVVPIALVLVMFYVGAQGFRTLREVPEGAMEVQVIGRMWDWSFHYENGKVAPKLYIPVDRPVKLNLKSVDVNHSFYVPAFRMKEDLIPGVQTYLWFKPQTEGPADIFCAEFCGQRHSYMMSEVVVLSQADFDEWYHSKEKAPAGEAVTQGGAVGLMAEKGCLDCHSLGTRHEDTGPPLHGLFGSTRTVLWGGQEKEVVADEEYLRRAIVKPDAERVKGYETNMPAVELTDEQVDSIIEYLRQEAK